MPDKKIEIEKAYLVMRECRNAALVAKNEFERIERRLGPFVRDWIIDLPDPCPCGEVSNVSFFDIYHLVDIVFNRLQEAYVAAEKQVSSQTNIAVLSPLGPIVADGPPHKPLPIVRAGEFFDMGRGYLREIPDPNDTLPTLERPSIKESNENL